jgi:hypothetical protein
MPSQKEDPLNSSQELINALRYCLKDFGSDVAAFKSATFMREERLHIPENLNPPAYIVFLMFVYLLGYKYSGREEKVAWTIPVTYKSTPFLLSDRKFGFRILAIKGTSPTQEVLNEMLIQLKRGTLIADRILQPLFQEQLQKGGFVIANSYIKLTSMYDFFRRKAKQAYNRKPRKPKVHKQNKEGIPLSWSSYPFEFEFQGFYYTVAMIDAFFSRLENLLVFSIPFVELAREVSSYTAFISLPWADKYKHIFTLKNNLPALKQYEKLRDIKEKYRNPISHGFFQKDNASIFIQMPMVGAVPLNLSMIKNNLHFSLIPISKDTYYEICASFDSFEDFLRSSSLKYALLYAEAGFDVAFDSHSIAKYREACRSEEEFEMFIEATSHYTDMCMNMDW